MIFVSSHHPTVRSVLTLHAGDQCGSVVLDQRFEQYIRGVLGNDVIDNMKVHNTSLTSSIVWSCLIANS